MTAPATPAYVAEQIADEIALLPLLGWRNIQKPREITPNCWVMGTHFRRNGHTDRNASTFCPRHRRSNDCMELIAPCQMMITCTESCATVSCPDGKTALASFADHPTKEDAIRAAMCKAATAYLTAQQAAK